MISLSYWIWIKSPMVSPKCPGNLRPLSSTSSVVCICAPSSSLRFYWKRISTRNLKGFTVYNRKYCWMFRNIMCRCADHWVGPLTITATDTIEIYEKISNSPGQNLLYDDWFMWIWGRLMFTFRFWSILLANYPLAFFNGFKVCR